MPKPPDDPRWDDVLTQVEQAFSSLDARMGDGTLRDTLLASLEAAWRTANDEVDRVPGGPRRPRVVVLDGGRGDDDTAEEPLDRPSLRVADDDLDDDLDDGFDDDFDDDLGDEPITAEQPRVRIVRVGGLRSPGAGVPLHAEGAISVGPGDDAWQTVLRAAQPRPYRLAATAGRLEIAVDGELVDALEPGQTVDLEGRLIRVRAGGDAGATGRYVRL